MFGGLGDWISGIFGGGSSGGIGDIAGNIGAGNNFASGLDALGGLDGAMGNLDLSNAISPSSLSGLGTLGGDTSFSSMSGLGDIGSLGSFGAGGDGIGSKALDFLTSDMMLGGKDQTGLLGQGINLATGLAKYGLGKDQLDMQKDAFDYNKSLSNANLSNQANLTNASLADRARTRSMSQGNASDSPELQAAVADYLRQYGARGSV